MGTLQSYSSLAQRLRVRSRIASAAERPVVVISAPAGYGKSIALSQYLETATRPVARFYLEPEHKRLSSFLPGLLHALAPVVPALAQSLASLLQSSLDAEHPVESLVDGIDHVLTDYHGIIAMDDFHLAEDREIASFLRKLIDRTKGRIQWFVGTRSSARLPIGTWLANGTIDPPLDESVLRFTLEDAREVNFAQRDRAIDESDLERLVALTAGWPTAFGLAMRVAAGDTNIAQTTVKVRYLSYEYLADQVYRSLTPAQQELLRFASLLPLVDVDVLEAAGFEHASETLHELVAEAAFLTIDTTEASSASPRRFRCHDLFRDFLRHQVEITGESSVRALRLRAARALAACGSLSQAITLFAAAGAFDELIAHLSKDGLALIDQGMGDNVSAAIDGIPADLRNSEATILGIRAYLALRMRATARAQALFERAIEASRDPLQRLEFTYRLAICHYARGDNEKAERLFTEIANAPQSPHEVRGKSIGMLLTMSSGESSSFDVISRLDELEEVAASVDSDLARAHMLVSAGITSTHIGESERAVAFMESLLELAERRQWLSYRRSVFSVLAENATLQGDLAGALRICEQELACSRQIGDAFCIRYATLRMFDLATLSGDDVALKALSVEVQPLANPTLNGPLYRGRALLAAWNADFDAAHRLLNEAPVTTIPRQARAVYHALNALLAHAARSSSDSEHLLTIALEDAAPVRTGRQGLRFQSQLATALCRVTYALRGKSVQSQRLAIESSPYPVVRALHRVADDIEHDYQNGIAHERAANLLRPLCEEGFGGFARILELLLVRRESAEPAILTAAEQRVLRALANGLSPKEISQLTGTSINTVRVHIRRIISKFNCSGKEQAISIARTRNLV